MQSMESLARNIKPSKNIVEEQHNLKCSKCGNTYDYYKFSNGHEFRHGCDCSMIQAGKEAEKKRKQKYINNIFNQSTVNGSLRDATVNNYKPQNEKQIYAKKNSHRVRQNILGR